MMRFQILIIAGLVLVWRFGASSFVGCGEEKISLTPGPRFVCQNSLLGASFGFAAATEGRIVVRKPFSGPM